MVFTPAKQTNKATSDDVLPLVVSTARGAAQPERERGKEASIAPVSPHRIASNDDCSLFSDTPTPLEHSEANEGRIIHSLVHSSI